MFRTFWIGFVFGAGSLLFAEYFFLYDYLQQEYYAAREVKKQAVEFNYAYYNPRTGEFTWK